MKLRKLSAEKFMKRFLEGERDFNKKHSGREPLLLTGARLIGLNAQGIDLQGADLTQANLDGAELKYSYLNEAKLIKTQLERAELLESNLHNTEIYGVDFSGAKLDGVDFLAAEIIKTNFNGAELGSADFSYSHIYDSNIWESHFAGATFRGVKGMRPLPLQIANVGRKGYSLTFIVIPQDSSESGSLEERTLVDGIRLPEFLREIRSNLDGEYRDQMQRTVDYAVETLKAGQ
ncbi:pentapeptide repeat-containing protein [Candidatus Pacearchaeota archaeon]|nr:pentapeptide repeat-containing protein [Candidatus Pacearchaeota archaeon]